MLQVLNDRAATRLVANAFMHACYGPFVPDVDRPQRWRNGKAQAAICSEKGVESLMPYTGISIQTSTIETSPSKRSSYRLAIFVPETPSLPRESGFDTTQTRKTRKLHFVTVWTSTS